MSDKPVKVMNAVELKAAVAREASREFSSQIKRHGKKSKNFADLLSRMYEEADRVLDAVEGTDLTSAEPAQVAKHVDALKGLAKLLPALQQAEKNARTTVKNKALSELSQEELERLGRQMLTGKESEDE